MSGRRFGRRGVWVHAEQLHALRQLGIDHSRRGTSAGGGAYGCTLNNCTLTDNETWGDAGGAAGECALYNCILYFNGMETTTKGAAH